MKRNPTPESMVIDPIKDLLKASRVLYIRMVGSPFMPKGVADLVCCQPVKVRDLQKAGIEEIGVFVAIECKPRNWKAPTKVGSREWEHYQTQKEWLDWVRRCKGVAFFTTDPEDVMEKLGLFGRVMPLFSKEDKR
jgi:hypothetical protein